MPHDNDDDDLIHLDAERDDEEENFWDDPDEDEDEDDGEEVVDADYDPVEDNYNVSWDHLDENYKLVTLHENEICFGEINHAGAFEPGTKYLRYHFANHDSSLTDEDLEKYFLYLRSIAFLRPFIPEDCKKMAENKHYTIDLTKANGLKVFTILTLLRAVREAPKAVHQIIKFDPAKRYKLSNWDIVKVLGALHVGNINHWVTMRVSKRSLNTEFFTDEFWNSGVPAIETGLVRKLHTTFSGHNDGWQVMDPVEEPDILGLLEDKPRKKYIKRIIPHAEKDLGLNLAF